MDDSDRVPAALSESRGNILGKIKSLSTRDSDDTSTQFEPGQPKSERLAGAVPFPTEEFTPGSVRQIRRPYYGYKATRNALVKLIIPREATVTVPRSDRPIDRTTKLRANEAYVEKIISLVTGKQTKSASSIYDRNYTYTRAEFHAPEVFDAHPGKECSDGIHFFTEPIGARHWWEMNHPPDSTTSISLLSHVTNRLSGE